MRQHEFGDADIALARSMARADASTHELVLAAAAVVSAATQQGHSCLPLRELDPNGEGAFAARARAAGITQLDALLEALRVSPWLARSDDAPGVLVLHHDALYLRRYYDYERALALALRARAAVGEATRDARALDLANADADQRDAVRIALQQRLLVLCGGPGSGKTWTLARIVAQWAQAGTSPPRIVLAAPTGKAAARLAESVRELATQLPPEQAQRLPREATTLHRLLGMRPQHIAPRRDAEHVLALDALIVDECSMVDLPLMTKLLRALPAHARVVLCGDPDQLPAIEGGAVFAALADAEHHAPWRHCVVRLRGARRFGDETELARVVAAVRAGDAAAVRAALNDATRTHVRWHDNAPDARDMAQFAQGYAPFAQARNPGAALRAMSEFRVLCALREGRLGAQGLNDAIERTLFGALHARARRAFVLAANAAALGLFNGDTGVQWPDDAAAWARGEQAWFDTAPDTVQAFAIARLPTQLGAYALTVHRAQGSEFQRVALVLPQQPHPLLSRQWLYTAVSRARTQLDLYAPWPVIEAALAKREHRFGGLASHV
jgi:exodeoxyribonuclease V alpha subunit